MKHFSCIAVITTLLLAASPATASDDRMAQRAAIGLTAGLSWFIANQGNAALGEIRKEVKKDLLERFKIYLPKREEIAGEQPLTQ